MTLNRLASKLLIGGNLGQGSLPLAFFTPIKYVLGDIRKAYQIIYKFLNVLAFEFDRLGTTLGWVFYFEREV